MNELDKKFQALDWRDTTEAYYNLDYTPFMSVIEDYIEELKNGSKDLKASKIEQIKKILKVHGCFSIGELDYFDTTPCVFSYGSVVGLVEYFTEDYADVNIYQTNSMGSDPIETAESQYEDFSIDILNEILYLCKMWEKQSSVVDEL
jgi:hypothetical protein